MPHRWHPLRALALPFLMTQALLGCASQPSALPAAAQEFSGVPASLDIGSTDTVYPGELDVTNRFLSNVIIVAALSDQRKEGCSGVLISPNRVLTAAHCVCKKRKATPSDKMTADSRLSEAFSSNGKGDTLKQQITTWKRHILDNARAIADASDCTTRVEVTVINHVGATKSFIPTLYEAVAVRPHPRFLSLDGDRNDGLFREADLATIQLQDAVPGSFRPIKWPETEVSQGQEVIMVGYGLGETRYPEEGVKTYRHYGESRVTQIDHLDSGSTRFAAAAQSPEGREFSRNYEGDSGGGVFRKEDDSVLVGIISARRDSQGGVFESVYPHLQWLKEGNTSD